MRHPLIAATLALGLLAAVPAAYAAPAPFQIAMTFTSAQDKALLLAVFKSDVAGVQQALGAGASANARFPGGSFSNEEATEFGVDAMEDMGAYTRLSNAVEGRMTALLLATVNGNEEIVNLLLAKKADPNKQGGDSKFTPLMQAAKDKKNGIAKALLEAGANVAIKTDADWSALNLAIGNDNAELASILFAKGAPVKDIEVDSMPIVAGAIAHKMFDLADAMIDKGAEVKMRVCIAQAIEKGSLPLVKKLVAKGITWDAFEVKLAKDNYQEDIEAFLTAEFAKRKKK